MLAVVAVAACDPSPPPAPSGTRSGTASGAERSAGAAVPQDPASVRLGRERFEAACGRCHSGDEPSGGNLADRRLSAEQVQQALHAGSEDGGLMAAVDPASLPESDLPALRAYLRSIHAER